MRHVLMIQDLQFGSTGKGQIAGSVSMVWGPDTVVTAWGPNAGHTFRRGQEKYVHTMLATAALCPTVEQILVGPGTILDADKLAEEIAAAERIKPGIMEGKQLIIHPQATMLKQGHADQEAKQLLRIGSTMKGTGAALCDKVMRDEYATVRGNYGYVVNALMTAVFDANMTLSLSSRVYDRAIDVSGKMIVEGAQGFSLGYHTDFYPYATSRDVSTAQTLADCRVPYPSSDSRLAVLGVCRTFPIRVANRKAGDVTYTSGSCYPDQKELSWSEDLRREPELTTVTKLPRRVFSFSHQQVLEAVRVNGVKAIALTFCDYLLDDVPYEGHGDIIAAPLPVRNLAHSIEQVTGVPVRIVSFGPDQADVKELDDVNVRELSDLQWSEENGNSRD